MQEEKNNEEKEESFPYMEKLSQAYAEAFAKRLRHSEEPLPQEKRELIVKMQCEISRTAGKLAVATAREERKELSRMIKESAEETLRVLRYDEEEPFGSDSLAALPPSLLLARAVLLANRCLNLLIRHTGTDTKLLPLVLSELSAIYALAAIN